MKVLATIEVQECVCVCFKAENHSFIHFVQIATMTKVCRSSKLEGTMRAHQVPLVFLAGKEDGGAREEVREKRRVTCVSLGAGSEAGEERRSRTRVRKQEEHAQQKRMEMKN